MRGARLRAAVLLAAIVTLCVLTLRSHAQPTGSIQLRTVVIDTRTGAEKLAQLPKGGITSRQLIADSLPWTPTSTEDVLSDTQQYLVTVEVLPGRD
jgi:hypothetical protein